MSDWWICGAGHSVRLDLRPLHERCADPDRRHPQVTLANAITTGMYTRTCYDDYAPAFKAMADARPYNNTSVSAGWCDLAHCPHGCRTGTAADRPVTQDPLPPDPDTDQVGCFRCPACQSEYVPGEWPAYGAAWMTGTLTGLGLEDAELKMFPGPAGRMTRLAADARFPASLNADVAGCTLRIHEDLAAARPGAGTGLGPEFREPVALFITAPGGLPVHAHAGLSVPAALNLVRGYAGLPAATP
jgi:hypothetical protein